MYGIGFSFSPSKGGRHSSVPISSESSDDYGDIHNEEDFLEPPAIPPKGSDLDHNRHTHIHTKATLNKAILSATNSKATTRNKANKSNAVGSGQFTFAGVYVCMCEAKSDGMYVVVGAFIKCTGLYSK